MHKKHSKTTHSPHLLVIVFTMLRVEPTISSLIGTTLEKSAVLLLSASLRLDAELLAELSASNAEALLASDALALGKVSVDLARDPGDTSMSIFSSTNVPCTATTDPSATPSPCNHTGETFQAQKPTFLLSWTPTRREASQPPESLSGRHRRTTAHLAQCRYLVRNPGVAFCGANWAADPTTAS